MNHDHTEALVKLAARLTAVEAERDQLRLEVSALKAMNHFNDLSPKQAELLAMLAEEAGEVVQVVGKILRHGLDSYHPDDPQTTNAVLLRKELTDLAAICAAMSSTGMIGPITSKDTSDAWNKKLRYAHHQNCDTKTTCGDLDYPAPNNHDHTKRGFDPS